MHSNCSKENSHDVQMLMGYGPNLFSQDGWILAKFFSCVFMNRDEVHVEVHKLIKKEWGQYPAILTDILVNN